MRVALLEVPAKFGEVQGQRAWVEAQLAGVRCDVVVLPETALTGYVSVDNDFDLSRFAEPLHGATTRWLHSVSKQTGAVLVGPLIERQGLQCFNTALAVDDGRVVAHYRKRHPWFPELWATPGDLPWPRFEVCGVRCSIAVCFDVHFLLDEAADVLRETDVLFFPSAWVDEEDSRPAHFEALARAFGVTVVNANWGEGSPRVPGQGGSMAFGPQGLIARTKPGEHVLIVDVATKP